MPPPRICGHSPARLPVMQTQMRGLPCYSHTRLPYMNTLLQPHTTTLLQPGTTTQLQPYTALLQPGMTTLLPCASYTRHYPATASRLPRPFGDLGTGHTPAGPSLTLLQTYGPTPLQPTLPRNSHLRPGPPPPQDPGPHATHVLCPTCMPHEGSPHTPPPCTEDTDGACTLAARTRPTVEPACRGQPGQCGRSRQLGAKEGGYRRLPPPSP